MDRSRTIATAAVLALMAGGGATAAVLVARGTPPAARHAVAPTTTQHRSRRAGTTRRPGLHLRPPTRSVQETTTTSAATTPQTVPPSVPAQPLPSTTAAVLPPATVAGHHAGAQRRRGTDGTAPPSRATQRPVHPPSPPPTVTAPFSGAAAQAEGEEASYVEGAWCGPLEEASGKPLAVLEQDVARSTAEMETAGAPALASSLHPATGQVEPRAGVMLLYGDDLATADAIVPSGANLAKAVLHTAYCVGAPGPLTGYQVVHGGAGSVDFEAAYGISVGHKTTWWHLWWQVAPAFGRCTDGAGTCLAAWDAPRSPVSYWAAQKRSPAPQYVVPGPGGTWRLTTPGQSTQRAGRPHKATKRPSKRAMGQTTKKG